MPEGVTYKDAGVDIDLGNDVSEILYNAARETWKNRDGRLGELIVPVESGFSSSRCSDISGLPEGTIMGVGSDGVGTKMEVAERVNRRTIAFDLIAMVCDDAVREGAEPALVTTILDVNSLGMGNIDYIEEVRQLAIGYIEAANAAGVAIANGEVAELGARVGGFGHFNCNWGANVTWYANKSRMIDGKKIKPGDYLIGLHEKGFRSNGFTLVRKVMEENVGPNWHKIPFPGFESYALGSLVLTPSTIYTKAVVDMTGGYDLDREPEAEVHGVAHITGGGIPEKLGRMLKPFGLGANIDSPFRPTRIMHYVQMFGISDEEAYKTFNMGQGMIIASPDPESVVMVAKKYDIEAKQIGYVTESPEIRIKNFGAFTPNLELGLKDPNLHGPKELVFN